MRFNFRKIASVIASAVMLGSTAGMAMAANYPAPFVVGGASDAAIVVTTGTHAGATSDWAAATSLQGNLQGKVTTTTSTSTATVTGEAAGLFTGGTKLYINDTINSVKEVLTKSDLPTILADDSFSGNVDSTYTQVIRLGSNPRLTYAKQPTSSYDPQLGFALSTSTTSYLYNATITFAKTVNLSHADSKNQVLKLFGQKFTIGSGTDNANLILFKEASTLNLDSSGTTSQEVTIGGKKYTVELVSASATTATIKVTNEAGTTEQKEVTEGYSKKINGLTISVQTADTNNLKYTASVVAGAEKYTLAATGTITKGESDEEILGTKATFTGSPGNPAGLTGITISVAAKDGDVDAILPGGAFVDPIFGTFKIDFSGLNIPDTNTTKREDIKVKSSGDDKMELTMTDHAGNTKTFQYVINATSATNLQLDDSGHNIIVSEMAAANVSDYLMLGNELSGHLVKVTTISNATASSADTVTFTDVFSGTAYTTSFSAENVGTVDIGGEQYSVSYTDSATSEAKQVRLNAQDSAANDMILYPIIQTSLGAKVGLYKPLTINLTNWKGSEGNLTNFLIPNGANAYQTIPVVVGALLGGNFTVGGVSVNESAGTITSPITITNTGFKLNFTWSAPNQVKVSLVNPEGGNVTDPAVFIYEEKDDNNQYQGLIVTTETGKSSDDGMGIDDVIRTWGIDGTWDAIALRSNSNKANEIDLWGTTILIDSSDSDQKTTTISYPDEQIYANVYGAAIAAEIGGGGIATGSILVVKDSEVDSVKDKNLIVVGGSCINAAAAKILQSATLICGPEFTSKTGVGAGQYIIKSVASPYNTAKTAILVAGYESMDTATAVAKLQEATTVTDVGTSKVYPETVTTA